MYECILQAISPADHQLSVSLLVYPWQRIKKIRQNVKNIIHIKQATTHTAIKGDNNNKMTRVTKVDGRLNGARCEQDCRHTSTMTHDCTRNDGWGWFYNLASRWGHRKGPRLKWFQVVQALWSDTWAVPAVVLLVRLKAVRWRQRKTIHTRPR